jgi:hypothetical protein
MGGAPVTFSTLSLSREPLSEAMVTVDNSQHLGGHARKFRGEPRASLASVGKSVRHP